MKTFLDWLQSVDGQERSPSQAQQIAVDVSKYLFLADSSKVDLTMAYNVDKANEFLDALKKQGLRAVGILGKILHLQNLLSFLETAIENQERRLWAPFMTGADNFFRTLVTLLPGMVDFNLQWSRFS